MGPPPSFAEVFRQLWMWGGRASKNNNKTPLEGGLPARCDQFSRHQNKCAPRFSRNDPARRRRPPSTWWSARATRVHARSSTSFHLVCTCCRRSNAHECMFCRWRRRSASRWIVGRSMVLLVLLKLTRAACVGRAPYVAHIYRTASHAARARHAVRQIVGGRFEHEHYILTRT